MLFLFHRKLFQGYSQWSSSIGCPGFSFGLQKRFLSSLRPRRAKGSRPESLDLSRKVKGPPPASKTKSSSWRSKGTLKDLFSNSSRRTKSKAPPLWLRKETSKDANGFPQWSKSSSWWSKAGFSSSQFQRFFKSRFKLLSSIPRPKKKGWPTFKFSSRVYFFFSKELLGRWIHRWGFLGIHGFTSVEQLSVFTKRINLLQSQVNQGASFDFPGPTDPFLWPTVIEETLVIDPCHLWLRHQAKARACLSHLRQLELFISPLFSSSPGSYYLLQRLYRWYFRYYGIAWFLLGCSSIPLKVSSAVMAPLFFFWRPSWDHFDQVLVEDDYFTRELPLRTIWFTLVFQTFPHLPLALSKVFFFQFLDREVRFWARFFNTVRWQWKKFSPKKLYHRFFEVEFKYWEDYPLWILYQFERLYLILPFLKPNLRSSLFFNTRVFFEYVRRRQEELRIDLVTLGYLARVAYWFRRQGFYFRKLLNQGLHSSFLSSSWQAFFFSCLSHRCFYQRFSNSRLLCRFFKSSSLFSKPLFSSSVLQSRLTFLKKKWKQLRQRKTQKISPLSPKPLPLVFSLKPVSYWSLLLFWSLSFFFRLQIPGQFFEKSRWLQCLFFWNPTFVHCSFSLEFIYSSVAQKVEAVDPLLFLASFHWAFLKPVEVSKKQFRQVFRQFFFPSEISAPEPVAFFYKRYNYVRCLPFRDFCHFWPQANNFARSKIKQHPRQFYGQSYRNPRVYHPLAYSVSLENSPSVQLQLTDKCLSNKFRFANLST